MKWILLLALLVVPSVLGANITGIVYDPGLQQVDAIVTISTEPGQRMVARNGAYAFTAPVGTYTLSAKATLAGVEWSAIENLTISSEGNYVLDLILEPTYGDDLGLEPARPPSVLPRSRDATVAIISVLAALCLLVALLLHFRRKPWRRSSEHIIDTIQKEDEYKDAVLEALRKNEGRLTQKELRKHVRFSEAKVSLVLSELEQEEKIKKVKKGRGNIIVLK